MRRSAPWVWCACRPTRPGTSGIARRASRSRRRRGCASRTTPPIAATTVPPATPLRRGRGNSRSAEWPVRTRGARSSRNGPAGAHEFAVDPARIAEHLVELVEILEHTTRVALGEVRDRPDGGVDGVLRGAEARECRVEDGIGLAEAPVNPLAHRLQIELRRRHGVWRVYRAGKVVIVRHRDDRLGVFLSLKDRD